MERYFNTEGICRPEEHYMIRLEERLSQIKRLFVDRGKYFIINRGRQYGKTTTLRALAKHLKQDYIVLAMDFQMLGTADFREEEMFIKAFSRLILEAFCDMEVESKDNLLKPLTDYLSQSNGNLHLSEMFVRLSRLCKEAPKPVILMIDEVDSASNNQIFIEFLAMLRGYYLNRENVATFHSVILAGVYDVKNLKLKIRPGEEHQYNSPWNIAAKFDIPMNFTKEQITGMLREYEEEHDTGMSVDMVAAEIEKYTSGYPYLVSVICKIIDEKLILNQESLNAVWSKAGINKAVEILLKQNIPLFDSLAKQLDAYPELKDMLEEILYQGKQVPYNPLIKPISLGVMFGYLKEENGHICVANRIFEMELLNMFIGEESMKSEVFRYGQRDRNQFVKDGKLDMDLVLEKFVEHFTDIYSGNDENFVEKYGRKLFLLYLKPVINGTGNYYLEAQTRDERRTDVIVDYAGEQFIIELKIWHGNEYHERGEKQLTDYLEYFHLTKGYMLSFNFNKKKDIGIRKIELDGKIIVEAVV